MIYHQFKTNKVKNKSLRFIFSSILKHYYDFNFDQLKKANIFLINKSYLDIYQFCYCCLLLFITVLTVVKESNINQKLNLAEKV